MGESHAEFWGKSILGKESNRWNFEYGHVAGLGKDKPGGQWLRQEGGQYHWRRISETERTRF